MSDHNVYPETKQPRVIERILKETHAPLILIIRLISNDFLEIRENVVCLKHNAIRMKIFILDVKLIRLETRVYLHRTKAEAKVKISYDITSYVVKFVRPIVCADS